MAEPQRADDQSVSKALDLMRQQSADRKREQEEPEAASPVSIQDLQATGPQNQNGQEQRSTVSSSGRSAVPSSLGSGFPSRPLSPLPQTMPTASSSEDSSDEEGMSDERSDALSSAGGDEEQVQDSNFLLDQQNQEAEAEDEEGQEPESTTEQARSLRQKERKMMRTQEAFIGKEGPEKASPGSEGVRPDERQMRDQQRVVALEGLRQQAMLEQEGAEEETPPQQPEENGANVKTVIRDGVDIFNAIHGIVDVVGLIMTMISLNIRMIVGENMKDTALAKLFPGLSRPKKMFVVMVDFCCCMYFIAQIGFWGTLIYLAASFS